MINYKILSKKITTKFSDFIFLVGIMLFMFCIIEFKMKKILIKNKFNGGIRFLKPILKNQFEIMIIF